jgi:hypothetical protein
METKSIKHQKDNAIMIKNTNRLDKEVVDPMATVVDWVEVH